MFLRVFKYKHESSDTSLQRSQNSEHFDLVFSSFKMEARKTRKSNFDTIILTDTGVYKILHFIKINSTHFDTSILRGKLTRRSIQSVRYERVCTTVIWNITAMPKVTSITDPDRCILCHHSRWTRCEVSARCGRHIIFQLLPPPPHTTLTKHTVRIDFPIQQPQWIRKL